MKKFDSTKITVKASNIISNKSGEVYDFVRYICYKDVRDKANKQLSTMKDIIMECIKGITNDTWETITKEELLKMNTSKSSKSDKWDLNKFIETRECLFDAESELALLNARGVNEETYKALVNADRIFLTLQAHTCINSILLDNDILLSDEKDENGNRKSYDFAPMIDGYYKTGKNISDCKKRLTKMFNSYLMNGGTLFYGVKTRQSDIPVEMTRHFFASFGGKAERERITKGESTEYGTFKYMLKKDKKSVLNSITTLFAVVLDNNNEIEVLKPQK